MKRQRTLLSALLLTFPASVWAQAAATPAPDQAVKPSTEPSPPLLSEASLGAAESDAAPEARAPETEPSAETSAQEGEPEAAAVAKAEVAGAEVPAAPVEAPAPESSSKKPTTNPDAIPELSGAFRSSQRGPIGLAPGAPQGSAIAGGVTPAFGRAPMSGSDWAFDIHGYLQLPLRIGVGEREDAGEGQKVTVLHTPPVLPGAFETFEYTGVTPDPWAQLNFSYGNRHVTATVIIAARTVSNANGYFDPSEQLGINDAFITYHPDIDGKAKYSIDVGAFANRYGIMGEYDMGRYGTPLVARVSGVGATGTAQFPVAGSELTLEAGIQGPLGKAPVGVEPAGWNGFTDANAGSTYALHGHAALGLGKHLTVGAHGIHAFAQDDRATTTTQRDGSIDVFGADFRLSMQRYGHLFLGYGFTNASDARSVSGVIRVLNAQGGLGLMEEYLGMESGGTGQLNTVGAQYDFSLGNALRHPKPFNGKAPDLVLSGFTLGTSVASSDEAYDGVLKLKYGGEASYTFLPWMGAGLRYDRVISDTDDASQTYAILSPRLIFKSDWASTDQVVLQYSRYFHGSHTAPVVGYPPAKDVTVVPDDDVISLTASMWW